MYSLLDENVTKYFDSSAGHNATGEIAVLKKILPLNAASSISEWNNDTVEVFRSCPSYNILGNVEKLEYVNVIGRNFRDSPSLKCRYTSCIASNWSALDKNNNIVPGKCRNGDGSITKNLSSVSFEEEGIFISKTRVMCPLPKSHFFQGQNLSEDDEPSIKCKKDASGSTYYLQECKASAIYTGKCGGNGYMRVYSLIVPCSDDENLSGACDDTPSVGTKLNPCLSQQILIEISNNGKMFSGNAVVVPHVVGLDRDPGNFNDYVVPGTHAIYTKARSEIAAELSKYQQHEALKQMTMSDLSICMTSVFEEEGYRARESGWFPLPFMHRAHLSFDFANLPPDMKYDEHFKIAIFARPSRCNDSICDKKRKRIPDMETLPCVQPMDLPTWFLDPSVSKHQLVNLTMLALDDAIFKAEIHIVHGSFLASAEYFLDSMVVRLDSPKRSDSRNNYRNIAEIDESEKRKSSPFLSWEEKDVHLDKFYGVKYSASNSLKISPPLNMPPRWEQFKKGRVLLSMNTTRESATPIIPDGLDDVRVSSRFWDAQYPTNHLTKEATDTFAETFHGLLTETKGQQSYNFEHMILPYLPFFSNCREFDSYIPLWALVESDSCKLPRTSLEFPEMWWRRDYPPLPHQDEIQPVGPFDFGTFYPIADWCEQKLFCQYEENLAQPEVSPRWFEASTGQPLFSIIRDPINYYDYTGKTKATASPDDEGGQKFVKGVKSSDVFVPVKVDRSAANGVEGGCTDLCFPRHMSLEISYYQIDQYTKRIVDAVVVYESFDKDPTNQNYEVEVKFYPLDYRELIIEFAYGHEIFLLLFSLIGGFTVFMAGAFWAVTRVTTQLESPPRLKFVARFWLTFPQAIFGFILGIIPVFAVTCLVALLLKGNSFMSVGANDASTGTDVFSSIVRHYMDSKVDPNLSNGMRQGRMGLAFSIMAAYSIMEGSKIFVPKRKPNQSYLFDDKAYATQNTKWMHVRWKRSNMIYTSFIMGLFLVVIVEWSFWNSFGTYIWEAIIALKVVNILVSRVVDEQLSESLLSAPVMTAMGMVQTLVTLSANDFMDFLLSYVVELGFLILERMYTDPGQSAFLEWIGSIFSKLKRFAQSMNTHRNCQKTKDKALSIGSETKSNVNGADIVEKSETVEPILDSYGSYCCDTMSMFYTPFVIFLLMIFREEMAIPAIYGIKEKDMEYYVLFALVIIPFQFATDIFIHGSQELFHGWKLYDYLMYTRYRFLQREARWKGLEDTLDECIDESLRSMDQMCFSSQFYMMLTVHVNGILYLVLGLQMMIRAKYNMFGDPVTLILIPYVGLCVLLVKNTVIWLGYRFNVWRIKHENTAWHAALRAGQDFDGGDQEMIQAASHEMYTMDQRITSETFRHKFLKHNRSWIIDQLPNILTPRTLRRSRPYLIGQFTKILNKLNKDISSDSEEEQQSFETVALNAPSRKLLKFWLNQAKRRIKLRQVVQPLILRARSPYCEQCLSQKLLQVEPLVDIEHMDTQFKLQHSGDEFNQAKWKHFWQKHQRYRTLCLPCISLSKQKERNAALSGDPTGLNDSGYPEWGAVYLDSSSRDILQFWYASAQEHIFGKEGRQRQKASIDISDDEAEDSVRIKWPREEANFSASSKEIATIWLRTARSKLQRDIGWVEKLQSKKKPRRSYLNALERKFLRKTER
eukprot:CAMPEP_0116032652 /NCGR_PEP_ID=MMETSP0321-20121206/18304_1 /TAXON_ID=163516 /ORGANISM="Leptocylindrus danicus var. danicus, Strain B650" /LENGTH=1662 /DNA_ID=CAMNT_0003508143 /DNA_START=2771 /DNA_END=7759 /DNA_ORIENTATION=+